MSKPTPWPHQVAGLDMALRNPAYYFAWDMGTGKSRGGCDVMARAPVDAWLICCPKAVVDVWPEQWAKWGDAPRAFSSMGKWTCARKAAAISAAVDAKGLPPTFVINYDTIWRPDVANQVLRLAKRFRLGVIADEAHRLKAPQGKASGFFEVLGRLASYMLMLSGTPMPHSPLDIFAQYKALAPHVFGTSFFRFRNRYALWGGFENRQVISWINQQELNEKFRQYAMVVNKRDVLDLPPVTFENRYVELSAPTRKLYRQLETELYAEIDEGVISIANAAVKVTRLQQLTSGHTKTEDGVLRVTGSEKEDALRDFLNDFPADEPLVVICKFSHDVWAAREVLCKANRGLAAEVTGQRNDLAAWRDGRHLDLILQIQAGGVGIDGIQERACYGYFYSVGHSLGDYEQVIARIDRSGQARPVTFTRCIARNTVDEKIYKALEQKKNVIEFLLASRTRRAT